MKIPGLKCPFSEHVLDRRTPSEFRLTCAYASTDSNARQFPLRMSVLPANTLTKNFPAQNPLVRTISVCVLGETSLVYRSDGVVGRRRRKTYPHAGHVGRPRTTWGTCNDVHNVCTYRYSEHISGITTLREKLCVFVGGGWLNVVHKFVSHVLGSSSLSAVSLLATGPTLASSSSSSSSLASTILRVAGY